MCVSLEGRFPIDNAGAGKQISFPMGGTDHNLRGASIRRSRPNGMRVNFQCNSLGIPKTMVSRLTPFLVMASTVRWVKLAASTPPSQTSPSGSALKMMTATYSCVMWCSSSVRLRDAPSFQTVLKMAPRAPGDNDGRVPPLMDRRRPSLQQRRSTPVACVLIAGGDLDENGFSQRRSDE